MIDPNMIKLNLGCVVSINRLVSAKLAV